VFFRRKSAPDLYAPGDGHPEPVTRQPKPKLGWLEKRDQRRRRRILFEEVLGWILVPAFIYLIYLAIKSVGGIPKELIDFGNELLGIVMKGGR
jgi:Fe2+ transport system protein B